MSLVGTSAGRPDEDYYPTPPDAVEALLSVETFTSGVLEPCCGDGAICKVLVDHGIPTFGSDLIDRGYGVGGIDYLTPDYPYRAANVITNPPYKYAQEFIEQSLRVTTGKVAMLCKLQFLEGAKRKTMFETTPLKVVYVFSKRLSMTRNGQKMANSGMIAFAWYVWEHGYEGPATVSWL